MKVKNVKILNIRFPTSKDNIGTDAVHVDCDYSATYVIIETGGLLCKKFFIMFNFK